MVFTGSTPFPFVAFDCVWRAGGTQVAGGLQPMLPLSKLAFASLGLCCLLTAVVPQFSYLSNGFDMGT